MARKEIMKLHEIVKSLQEAQGNINKQAILNQYKDDALFKEYMRAVYDPALNYYQSKIKDKDKFFAPGMYWFDGQFIDQFIDTFSNRKLTGNAAATELSMMYGYMYPENQELLELLVKRSIGASVGDTMVLKTWPDLYFSVPYQRCSLMDDKAKLKFGKLKKFYVQTKADGSFAYLVKRLDGSVDVITRQGSKYPQEFAQKLCKGLEAGMVVVGELEVFERQPVDGWGNAEYLLDRKTGNGLLNSALKDGEISDNYVVKCVAWDMLTQQEFEEGKSSRTYQQRWEDFKISGYVTLAENVSLIPTWEVSSLEEAYAIYTRHTSKGLEGCIIKDPASLWKDGTAKDIIKLKLKFEAEYLCTGMYEGEGKAKGMMGGANYTAQDYAMDFNCGTGFSDDQRKAFWADPTLIVGKVSMLSANDIIQSRDLRKKPALSLPVFEEVRFDKTVANTLAEVEAIVAAAKAGK